MGPKIDGTDGSAVLSHINQCDYPSNYTDRCKDAHADFKGNHWDYAFDHIKKICDLRMHTNEYMLRRKVAQKQVGVEQVRDHVVARS